MSYDKTRSQKIQEKDYYKILCVEKTCSKEELKIAYRKLAKKYHPDVNDGNKTYEDKFKTINEAYEVLGDAVMRKKYDGQSSHAQYRPNYGYDPFKYTEYYTEEELRTREKKYEDPISTAQSAADSKSYSSRYSNSSYSANHTEYGEKKSRTRTKSTKSNSTQNRSTGTKSKKGANKYYGYGDLFNVLFSSAGLNIDDFFQQKRKGTKQNKTYDIEMLEILSMLAFHTNVMSGFKNIISTTTKRFISDILDFL